MSSSPPGGTRTTPWSARREAAARGGGGYVCTACRGSFRYNTVFWNRSRQGPVFEFYWGVADVIGSRIGIFEPGI